MSKLFMCEIILSTNATITICKLLLTKLRDGDSKCHKLELRSAANKNCLVHLMSRTGIFSLAVENLGYNT